jgi:RHS repeat-associated protein
MLYDERDLPFREIRAPGSPGQSTTQYDYDGNRNRVRTSQGLEDTPRPTLFTCDGFNRLVSIADAMSNVMTNNYDANGNRINIVVFGELIDVPGGGANVRLSQTAFFFDPMNRLTNQSIAFFNATNQAPISDGFATTQVIYSDNSQVLAAINDNNHGKTNIYDTANRLNVFIDAKGNTVSYSYDSDSNVSGMLEAEKSDLDGHVENFTTTFGYDNLNRLVDTSDNIGNLNRSGYDSRNNRTVNIDALTNQVLQAYDGLDRLTQTTRLMTQDGTGTTPVTGQIVTRQTWDDTSRLTSQIDDNTNATTYLYDGLNRKFATVYADFTGQTNAFDVHHNAIRFTDANGNIVTNRYNLLNRVTNKLVTVGPTVAATTTFERFQYDGLSRLVSASNDVSLVTRSYDSLGHVTREVQALINSVPAVVGSMYDGLGNLIQLNYPGGRVVTTAYDELERKKIISDTNGMIATYYFVGPKRVARRDYGNGTRCDYSHDGIMGIPNPAGDFGVKHIIRTIHTNFVSGGLIDDRTYAWDRVGNKTLNKDVRDGGPQLRRDYGHDSVHRLRTSDRSVPTGIVETVNYNLDGVGNRISVIGGTNAGAYTMDSTLPEPADRQMNQYTMTPFDARINDLNGNLTVLNVSQATQRAITYDYRNRMIRHTNAASGALARYAYDALGRRIQKLVSGATLFVARFTYHHWREIEEQDGAGILRATTLYGRYIDELLNVRRGGSNVFFHSDDLYNVMEVTDAAGGIAERYEYSDFGTPSILDPSGALILETAISNSYLFNGHRYDSENALIEFRTRYLETKASVFTTRDRIGIWGDRSKLGNGQAYEGSPVSKLDPYGLASRYFDPSYDTGRQTDSEGDSGRTCGLNLERPNTPADELAIKVIKLGVEGYLMLTEPEVKLGYWASKEAGEGMEQLSWWLKIFEVYDKLHDFFSGNGSNPDDLPETPQRQPWDSYDSHNDEQPSGDYLNGSY